MSFFSKLAFWKRDELPELPGFGGNEAATDLSAAPGGSGFARDQTGLGEFKTPETPTPQFGQENYANITPPPGTPPPQPLQEAFHQDIASKNMEIISSKIDYLKASLENINQRLANIEAIARGEEQKPRYRF